MFIYLFSTAMLNNQRALFPQDFNFGSPTALFDEHAFQNRICKETGLAQLSWLIKPNDAMVNGLLLWGTRINGHRNFAVFLEILEIGLPKNYHCFPLMKNINRLSIAR